MTFCNLTAGNSSQLFSEKNGHFPVQLSYLHKARVIWINRRAMRSDPAWITLGKSESFYEKHLLESCAFISDPANESSAKACGHADRYGGSGIGKNGGSGRAIVLGAYLIKGIGRTPLVGLGTDEGHSSGGAYLEECVREAILGEIAAAEYPYGSIPTLAIIDTGLSQIWNTDKGPKVERRCLLVRPNFIRPAHFERAEDFNSGDPREGSRDSLRVGRMLESAASIWSSAVLIERHKRFWVIWAEQMAYGYIHRLPHCAHTTSNVCIEGQLVDFGAMAAMPNWARIDTSPNCDPTGAELETIMISLFGQLPQLARLLDPELGRPEMQARILRQVRDAYARTLRVEMLRVFGLTRECAIDLLDSAFGIAISHELKNIIVRSQCERFAIYAGTPKTHLVWDINTIWSPNPATYLIRLRQLIEQYFQESAPIEEKWRDAVPARCAFRALDRRSLYREALKHNIYETLERNPFNQESLRARVSRLIRTEVLTNRRDCKTEPPNLRPIGFASGYSANYSLYESSTNGRYIAYHEWQSEETLDGSGSLNGSDTTDLDSDGLIFSDAKLTTENVFFT